MIEALETSPANPDMRSEDALSWIYPSKNGLEVDVGPITSARVYALDNETMILPEGAIVANMDFTPINGMPFYIPGTRFNVLRLGLAALSGFFDYIDLHCNSSKKVPDYLIGNTNMQFARLLERKLGFQRVVQKDQSGKLVMLGKAGIVKSRLAELKNTKSMQRLELK